MTLDGIISFASSCRCLKPFNDSGVDMIQLRLTRENGRWPKSTIFVDCIQIKPSDQSTICTTNAEEIATRLWLICPCTLQKDVYDYKEWIVKLAICTYIVLGTFRVLLLLYFQTEISRLWKEETLYMRERERE